MPTLLRRAPPRIGDHIVLPGSPELRAAYLHNTPLDYGGATYAVCDYQIIFGVGSRATLELIRFLPPR